MNATGTFDYHSRWWLIPLMLSAVLMQAMLLGTFAAICWSVFNIGHEIPAATFRSDFPGFAWKALVGLASLTVSMVLSAWAVLRKYLEFYRASITINDDGMVVTDWRCRRREFRWADVREVKIWLSTQAHNPPTRVLTARYSLSIPRESIQDREVLIDEIIARSGLIRTSDSFLVTSYGHAEPGVADR